MYSVFYRRCFVIASAVLLGYALCLLLGPLRAMIGWAVVLAFILYPVHERFARSLKGRQALSAGVLTLLTPFVVLVPLSVLGVVFAGQIGRLISYMRSHTFLSYPELVERLSNYPLIGGAVAWVRDNAGVSADELQNWMTQSLEALLKSAANLGGDVALGLFGTVLSFFMMLFLLFFFIKDGRRMLEGLTPFIPMEPARRRQLVKYLGDVTRAVVFGYAATALINGVIVGIGFAIAGLPSPVVFGVLGMIAAFLPSGSAIVLIPGVIYLAATGRWGWALFLGLWTVGMWVLENVLRPILTAHRAEVSSLAIFIGAIGGVTAFGILGLVIGPVLLSFVVALLRYAREHLPADA